MRHYQYQMKRLKSWGCWVIQEKEKKMRKGDIITQSPLWYSGVLHCLLLVSGEAMLVDYLENVKSWDVVHSHAHLIYEHYANTDLVQEMCK